VVVGQSSEALCVVMGNVRDTLCVVVGEIGDIGRMAILLGLCHCDLGLHIAMQIHELALGLDCLLS